MTHGIDLVPTDDPERTARDERFVRRHLWSKLRRTLGRVPFTADALAAWYCLMDDRTPARARAILVGALAYFILPADMLPDVVLGLGFTDDATVLLAAIQTIRLHLLPEHYEKARAFLKEQGKA
ncbi:MAG TPA: YkvA family protein [Azospirillaceae bacterium]|nr:YkvA family protein [Azospirillaceae bacterium]